MKIAIITGADGDMGMEETRAMAQAGYHTIMACYCPAKAQEKCEKLKKETGNDNIEVMGIDLANLQTVRNFADTIKERFGRVDRLMNNAGTLETGQHFTVDGLERTISVNYVGPFLLTRLLLPLMPEGARIVNMASCVHPLGRLNFPHFFEKGCKGCFMRIWPYSNSKLAITLFTFELAKRIKKLGITVNAVDPGIVDTGIIRMQMFFDPITDLIFRPVIRTPLQGRTRPSTCSCPRTWRARRARSTVHAVSSAWARSTPNTPRCWNYGNVRNKSSCPTLPTRPNH